jgi:hypothetical protein
MSFYFTLPQTLIRYFASDVSKHKDTLIFIPEGKLSTTGRDNVANYEICKQIVNIIAPTTKLRYWSNQLIAPNLSLSDGIGDEILRNSPTYPWKIRGSVNYIVQHSALGYAGVNIKILRSPKFFARAAMRTHKHYQDIKFKRFLMYCGSTNTQLTFTNKPWHKIQIIKHSNLLEVCEKLKIIVPEFDQLFKSNKNDTNGNLLLLATGDYSHELKKIRENILLSKLSLYIKDHPQQSSRLMNKFELQNTRFLSNKSIPVELYICLLKPQIVIGPKSSVNFFCDMPYKEYTPLDWPVETEANLIDMFRKKIYN